MWIRKPGWPTSWPGSPSPRSTGSTNSCLGTGDLFKRASVRRPDLVCHHKRLHHHTYVAEMLGEDVDWLHELSIDMFSEDGCLRVYGVGEDGVPAFTEYGIECLKQIIADKRAAGGAPPPIRSTK